MGGRRYNAVKSGNGCGGKTQTLNGKTSYGGEYIYSMNPHTIRTNCTGETVMQLMSSLKKDIETNKNEVTLYGEGEGADGYVKFLSSNLRRTETDIIINTSRERVTSL